MRNPLPLFWRARQLGGLMAALALTSAWGAVAGWWPEQKLPKTVITAGAPTAGAALSFGEQVLLQSVAGLAAKAVNAGTGTELVWITTDNAELAAWQTQFQRDHPNVRFTETLPPWDLVTHFANRGLVKGYILYRQPAAPGHQPATSSADQSVNVATSLAGILNGVLVEESLENEARARGLTRLLDARDKTSRWCFTTYQNQFHRRLLALQDPNKPHTRDFAIAHHVLTLFGEDATIRDALAWLEPLAPILGWNSGDEYVNTELSTRYGHIQTATDWCFNLPVLMAGAGTTPPPRIKPFDPTQIDWADHRSAVSFVLSDGDNVQWLQSSFFRNSSYWASPARGQVPFGWSVCFTHLAQLVPQAIAYAVTTQTPNDAFIEWGGGYYYADQFGRARTNRWELLAAHARRTAALLQASGTQMIGLSVAQHESAEARQAYEVFARETEGLLGILIFQYHPYEGGAGKIVWVKDRNGFEVPVMPARYALWENANHRPRAGTPAKVAREIRATLAQTGPPHLPRYDWVIAHAWSYFRAASGTNEAAENLPQANAETAGGHRGYLPVRWGAERLAPDVRVVRPEELAWRLRMQHDAAQTRDFMKSLKP